MAKSPTTRKTITRGKFLQLVNDGGWEYAERVNASGVVAIIATTAKRELVLTEQYRAPVKRAVIDLPAGLAGDISGQESEALVEAAKRELAEETGYEGKLWREVYASEIVVYFQTSNARKLASGGGVEGEQITSHAIPLRSIRRWLKTRMAEGVYVDPKVYVALAFLR